MNSERRHRAETRKQQNEEFFERLKKRNPRAAREALERAKRKTGVTELKPTGTLEAGFDAGPPMEMVFETLVADERPVLFVENDWINLTEVTIDGHEAQQLIDDLNATRERLQPLMPLVGRIDVTHFFGMEYVGTGWLVAEDIVITNRHVATLIARNDGRKFVFSRGVGGKQIESSFCTGHEFDDLAQDSARIFGVKEVLYIEGTQGPDVAFLRISRRADGNSPKFIPIADTDIGPDEKVVVVGYPARASKKVIPDQEKMKQLYRDKFDVKRAAPGFTLPTPDKTGRHDCTTLGGNSGSVVLDLKSGKAAGLHFAGLYQEANFAVSATVLTDYVKRKRWSLPPVIETPKRRDPVRNDSVARQNVSVPPLATAVHAGQGSVTISVPVNITISVGTPSVGGAAISTSISPSKDPRAAEAAVAAFWDNRPNGVVAARVGFREEDDDIGDVPLIAASVPVDQLAAVQAAGPATFQGYEVRYYAADATEIIESEVALESVDSIAYDDDKRTDQGFSFAPVNENVEIRAHVGPEYSWDELKAFLEGGDSSASFVSGIYEFHAKHIAEAIEHRLDNGSSLELVMDNLSFVEVEDTTTDFDRVETFEQWETFGNRFKRIVAPEGKQGLISDAYHIKVTVRDDDVFWLSSGNWKAHSSQPVVTQEQRDNATDTDIEGNREWHVVVRNRTLADRFRNHLRQDFVRSEELGAGPVPHFNESLEGFVDIAVEEAPLEERRPPSAIIEPKTFSGKIKVQPLLTPDKEGAVYSEAVLKLIRSAKKSLLFQIPYIGMRPNPRVHRGFIDDLIEALTLKLKDLDDCRVLLRAGGSKFSAPTHAAWFFKSKGVDIADRLRRIDDHHTKGMIVDGKKVLIGSHNWSKPGVTLNRDASLIIDDADIADYFTQAFEVDWARANPIKPKKFVKEGVALESLEIGAAPGFRRVSLVDLFREDD